MSSNLRIVTFNFANIGYQVLTGWIAKHGHNHVLAVTTPGPKSRPTPSYIDVVKAAPRDVDVLVTTRMRTVATPLIRELKPDLILVLSFPYRLSPELCEIPTYGAINLHPALLPAYRGPNVTRQIYDGASQIGATAHWIAPEYDTGNILAQSSMPLPEWVDATTVLPSFVRTMSEALAKGIEKGLMGDPGTTQDESLATYSPAFSEDEAWLDWTEPRHVLNRKAIALILYPGSTPRIKIAGSTYIVSGVTLIDDDDIDRNETAESGTVLSQTEKEIVLQVGDGPVKLSIGAHSGENK